MGANAQSAAGDLAGKWVLRQESPGFTGDITLKLGKDGTFKMISDGVRDGQRVGGVSRGSWHWTGNGVVIQLSDRADPVDLGTFERSLSFVSTGSAAIVYFVALAISFILSLFFLRRYRLRVRKLMGAKQTESPPEKLVGPRVISDEEAPETAAYRAMKKRRRETLAAYAIAGLGQAVLATLFWINNGGLPLRGWLFLTLFVVHAWPALVAHFILSGRDVRSRIALGVAYIAFLGVIAVGSGMKPIETSGVRLSATGQVYFLWAGLMFVPTFAVWCFLRRRIRSAGPLMFTLCLFPMIGSWIGLVLMDEGSADATLLYLDAVVAFSGVLLISALACLPVGWFLGRVVGWLYGRKVLNDQTITIDALWLNFSLVESVHFALDKGVLLGVGQALLLFGVYRLVLTAAFRWLTRGSITAENKKLLLLRVFRSGRGVDRLMEAVGGRWVYTGSIQLIGGPDLATSTARPDQFLDFMRRRLNRHFAKSVEDANQRVNELDLEPDPDGRYRVNEILCEQDVWREAVQRLAETTDAVLMDLRGFHSMKQGVRFELRVLFETVSLRKVIFLVDQSTTDERFQEAIREARQTALPGGAKVRVFVATSMNAQTGERICKALLP